MFTDLFVFEDRTRLSWDLYPHYVEHSEIVFRTKNDKKIELSSMDKRYIVKENDNYKRFSFSLKDFGEVKEEIFCFDSKKQALSVVKKILNIKDYKLFCIKFKTIVNDKIINKTISEEVVKEEFLPLEDKVIS